MNASAAALLALVLAALLANFPFLAPMSFIARCIGRSREAGAGIALRLADCMVLYAAWIATCLFLEDQVSAIHAKDWSVWPISIAFYSVLAFPGVTYRYLWNARTRA